MNHRPPETSRQLRRALLQSQRRRILGLIVVLLVLAAMVLVRAAILGGVFGGPPVRAMLLVVPPVILYEAFMLRLVRLREAAARDIPNWVWVIGIIIECSVPSVALLAMTHEPAVGPYHALVAPTILIYSIFILLSTLNLQPALCVLAGAVCAVGYSGVLIHTLVRFPATDIAQSVWPLNTFIVFPVLLLLVGIVAGLVAGEVRDHAVEAIDHAAAREKLVRDLEIARSIQSRLLPSVPPTVPGYDIAGFSRPAEQTGGDHYDWQRLRGGGIGITLADVTGHGVGPALVTALCRAYARATIPAEASLSDALNRVNLLIADDLTDGRFITFAAAVLDPARHSVGMLSAGHGPLLHFHAADGSVSVLDCQGPPLAIDPASDYRPVQVFALEPGDFLLLPTDGIFEWANARGERFGIPRLTAALAAAASKPAAQIIASINDEVARFAAGAPQQDDVTAVVIKRNAT